MDNKTLSAELVSGHPDTGTYDPDPVIAAGQLNTVNRNVAGVVSSSKLLAWAGGGGIIVRIKAAAESHASDVVQGVAIAAATMVAREGTQFDATDPSHLAMLGALVAGSVITQAESDSLVALATTQKSRADELGLGWVRPGNITEARG